MRRRHASPYHCAMAARPPACGLIEAGTLVDQYGATRIDHFTRLARVVAEIEASVRDIAPFSFEERIHRADDGSVRHLHSQGAVIADLLAPVGHQFARA